jgi:hypothetical protein
MIRSSEYGMRSYNLMIKMNYFIYNSLNQICKYKATDDVSMMENAFGKVT